MKASNTTTASETVSLTRRYPGVRPFRDKPEEHALFFGRKQEIEQLHLRVLSVSLLVQFAKSGLGKTSLLQAGLFPLLRQKPFLPVLVRLNQEEPLVHSVIKAMGNACLSEGLDFTAGETSGLWELLVSTIVWRDDLLLTPVLVFDQFEEVFTLRSKDLREELAKELSALASGNPPERIRAAQTGISQDFAKKVKIRIPKVKIIISLREEYLGALEEFSLAIPQLFEERLRLKPISESGAHEAIERPTIEAARADGVSYWSPPFKFEPEAIKNIIAFLKGKSGVIEPFQLQLLCQHAEGIAFSKSKVQAQTAPVCLTMADLGDTKGLTSVLERFYKNTINKLPKSQRAKARLLCEEGLLETNGHRLMLDKEQIHSDYRVTEEALEILTQDRLLVREPRLDSIFYEISHDRLAESIQRARPFRLSRKSRHRLLIGAVVFLGMFLFAGLRVYEINQERLRAEKLLGFMLGEKLQAEMRDVGRGDILEMVQEKSEEAVKGKSFNRGLAFRNSGNLYRSRGNLREAIENFRKAQEVFEGLVETEGDRARIELARTFFQLGESVTDNGRPSEALKAYEQAVQIRRDIVNQYPRDAPAELIETYAWNSTPALELAEALESLGGHYYSQMGEIQKALKNLEEAMSIAQNHLFETAESAKGDYKEFELTANSAAIKVLADAVVDRAIILNNTALAQEDFDPGLFIVREFLLTRPLSAELHLAESQAIFWRATSGDNLDTDEIMAELKKVSDGFEKLRRVDPKNTLWRRDWAVTHGIISNYVLQNCLGNDQSHCRNKDFVMMEGERQNLEEVEQLRALASKDESNFSLKYDLAYALLTRAVFLKEKQQSVERMRALDEAVQIISQSIRDEKDAAAKSSLAGAYQERAVAWQDQGNVKKALEDLQQARAIYEGLVDEHPDHPTFRDALVDALSTEIKLCGDKNDASAVASLEKLKAEQEKARDQIRNAWHLDDDYKNPQRDRQIELANEAKEQNKPEVAIAAYLTGIEALMKGVEADPNRAAIWNILAQTQLNLAETLAESNHSPESVKTYRQALQSASRATEISPQNAQYQNWLSLVQMYLGDALRINNEFEAAREQFHNSLASLRTALTLDHTEPVYHSNMRDVYERILEVDEALVKYNPENQHRLLAERSLALRQRLCAAWQAMAFSPDQTRNKQIEPLLIAKRNMAKFLAFEKESPEQALPLMEQALVLADKIVVDNPQNPSSCYCRLGEADYAIGSLQRKQFLPGWEESIRKGLSAIDWGIALHEDGLCFKYSGCYRKNLGKYLLQDGRHEEARRELELAHSASQKALEYWPDDEDIKRDIEEELEILNSTLSR